MQTFFDFLIDYKEIILTLVCIVVSVLGIFLKKRPKTLDDFLLALNEAMNLVPELCSKYEKPGSGAEKRLRVLQECRSFMKLTLGRELSENEDILFVKNISKQIESVLAAPQKKGK